MKIANKLRIALRALLLKAGELATNNGTLIWDGEGELAVGMDVFVQSEGEGETEVVPAPDGTYETEEKVITVADGKVASIEDKEPESKNQVPQPEPEPEPEPDPTPDPESPVEGAEEEPQADPADEREEQEEERSIEDRVADLEARMGQVLEAVEVIINSFSEVESRLASLEEKIAKLDAEPAGEPAEQREDMSEVPQGRLGYVKALMKK